ncbi:MAG: four helix bundle protein, partial [Elusimicrobia bacterium]|nr:four helix bundle protein [Elusimicrobiota bacterium]
EAAETQTWLRFSQDCGYLDSKTTNDLHNDYNHIISMLVCMITQVKKWIF